MKPFTPFLILTLMLVGCNTTDTAATKAASTPQGIRIAELKSDYDKMPAPAKEEVAKGFISRGQSPEIVYIALGRPDIITSSADGRTTRWTYHNFVPPQTESAKKEAPKQVRGYNRVSNPLNDTFDAWRHNVSKYEQELSSDPDLARKAPNQSWADYGKYVSERRYVHTEAARKALDDEQRQEYQEALKEDPLPEPIAVKLDVVFLGQQVSDAIANDSVSAFILQP